MLHPGDPLFEVLCPKCSCLVQAVLAMRLPGGEHLYESGYSVRDVEGIPVARLVTHDRHVRIARRCQGSGLSLPAKYPVQPDGHPVHLVLLACLLGELLPPPQEEAARSVPHEGKPVVIPLRCPVDGWHVSWSTRAKVAQLPCHSVAGSLGVAKRLRIF